jgi:hypothetical protein
MLTWENAKFLPTRSARIVNVRVHSAAKKEDDVIQFHLELRGFIDPESPHIETLVKDLQKARQLPFGDRNGGNCWVSMLPKSLDQVRASLISDADNLWTKVVDQLFHMHSQFKVDYFWRILDVIEVSGRNQQPLPLRKRLSNKSGGLQWHKDYTVHDNSKYEIHYETHNPTAQGRQMPGGAKLILIPNDSDALVRVPTQPAQLRPNHTGVTSFSIEPIRFVGNRFARIELETHLMEQPVGSDIGSRCALTFKIAKSPLRLVVAAIAAVLAPGLVAATTAYRTNISLAVPLGISAFLLAGIAYYVWTGRTKI